MFRIKHINQYLMATGMCLILLAGSPAVSPAAEESSDTDSAAQELLTAPDSCTVSVSAQALGDSEVSVQVSLSCRGGNVPVDLLNITLPGQSAQVLAVSGSAVTFTAVSDLEGASVSYVPGTSAAGDALWLDSLKGTFTIPVVHTSDGDESDHGSLAEAETTESSGVTDESDTSDVGSADSGSTDAASGSASGTDPGIEDTGSQDGTDQESASGTDSSETSNVSVSGTGASSSDTSDSTNSSSSSKSSTRKKTRKSSSASSHSSSSGSGTSGKSHSGAPSGHGSGSGSSSHSGSTRSRSSSGTESEESEITASDAQAVIEAVSSLGKRLLKNGETLTADEENAPQMDGLTYEATWEDEESGLYLYEEGYAVLEVTSVSSGSSRLSASRTLQFLLLPEQTEEGSLSSILESWAGEGSQPA